MKTFRWQPRQKELIAAIYHLGDVWAIGGKRSGKSTALTEACRLSAFEWEPEASGIMAAPTLGQLERNLLEPWRELVPEDRYREVNDPKNPHILCYQGGGRTTKIYKASGKYPKHIEGLTVGWCCFTELQDGESFWETVKARVSDELAGKLRRFGDGLPEEGWLAREFEGKERARYKKIPFTMFDNQTNLHPSYIDDMLSSMTPREKLMYVDGLFVAGSKSVYPYFRRAVHAAGSVSYLVGTKILVGLDFNLRQQSAVFAQWHGGALYVFDEIMLPGTTQDQAKRLKEKLRSDYHLKPEQVLLIPDASGKSRQHVNTKGQSSFAVLEKAGFKLKVGAANPHVEDRDLSVNVLLENAKGQHRIFIDRYKCPRLVDSLAGLKTDEREDPFSDACDALGYIVWAVAPQRRVRNQSTVTKEDVKRLPAPRSAR